jgi:hypothetical protein
MFYRDFLRVEMNTGKGLPKTLDVRSATPEAPVHNRLPYLNHLQSKIIKKLENSLFCQLF